MAGRKGALKTAGRPKSGAKRGNTPTRSSARGRVSQPRGGRVLEGKRGSRGLWRDPRFVER